MITVYSVETGQPVRLHPIDAREQLELKIVTLEPPPAAPGSEPEAPAAPDKAALVARAAELGIAPPSHLTRWGVEKLKAAIAEAEG